MKTRFLVLCLLVLPACLYASATYRWVAVRDGDVCLIGSNGLSRLVLAKGAESVRWESVTISPTGSHVVAEGWEGGTGENPRAYCIDPTTGNMHRIPSPIGNLQLPETPVWSDGNTVLLESFNGQRGETSLYAVDVRTGKSRMVVPAVENECGYDRLLISPSGKLLATGWGMTNAFWISVADLSTGKLKWRTNPERGVLAQTGVVWSHDSRSLLVSFWKEDEFPGPGGLWRFDALTGSQSVWKYPGRAVFGVWVNRDSSIIAVSTDDTTDILRRDGKIIFSPASTESIGTFLGAFVTRHAFLYCGDTRLEVVDLSTRRVRYWSTRPIAGDNDHAILSPDGHEVIYTRLVSTGPTEHAGVVNARTGRITKLVGEITAIAWLPHEITR